MKTKHLNLFGSLLFLGCLFLNGTALGQIAETQLQFLSGPEVRANPNPAVPLAAILTFETKGKVNTRIEILAKDNSRVLKYGTDKNLQYGLSLIGFFPGVSHKIRVTISDAEGNSLPTTASVDFTAPKLPVGAMAFPIIEARKLSNVPMEPGVTIFNPRRRIMAATIFPGWNKRDNQGFGLLVAVDASGNVIWYYQGDSRVNSEIKQLRNGNILFLTQNRAVEIDLLGNTVAQWYAQHRPQGPMDNAIPVDALTFHHDIEELPNGNFLVLSTERKQVSDYFTSEVDEQAPRKAQWVMGDEVIEFRRDGTVVWRWKAFEHLDVFRIGYETLSDFWRRAGFPDTLDWSHANSVLPLDDESILVNFRNQSAITKIHRKTGKISWIAGESSGWSKSLQAKLLTMKGNAKWFWFQHGPTITPTGTLLLFDNDIFQARPFDKPIAPAQIRSRAVEYAINQEEMTLREEWSSVISGDPPVVSYAMGSAQYLLKTGNILAGFGFLLPQDDFSDKTWHPLWKLVRGQIWTRVREYTHDSPPKVVWDLTLRARENDFGLGLKCLNLIGYGLGWNIFGAKRIELIPSQVQRIADQERGRSQDSQ